MLGHFCDDGKGRSQNQHKKRKQNPLFICMVNPEKCGDDVKNDEICTWRVGSRQDKCFSGLFYNVIDALFRDFLSSQTSKLSLEILDFSIRKKIVRKKHRTRLRASFMNMYVTYRTTSSQFEYRRTIAIALWHITLLFHPVARVDSRNMIGRNSYIRTYNVIIFHSVIEN